jgi:hypothetical protein
MCVLTFPEKFAEDSCLVFLGSSVWNAPNYLAARSSNWALTSIKRSEANVERNASNCAEVDTFGFTGKEGKVHEVKIPPGKTFAELEDLAGQGKFDELLKLAGN